MEEGEGNEQADPDDEAEQADHIHHRQAADAFLTQLVEVGDHADAEEGQQEEDDAEAVGHAGDLLADVVDGAVGLQQQMNSMIRKVAR